MINKNIFFKNKKNKIIKYLFISLISFILCYFSYLKYFHNDEIFIISKFESNFFKIPNEIGGKKPLDLDISILANYPSIDYDNNREILEDVKFSLQLFSSNSLKDLQNSMKNLIKDELNKDKKYFIVKIDTSFGPQFLLLYNNYNLRDSAKKDCELFLYKGIKCLVVNVQNL